MLQVDLDMGTLLTDKVDFNEHRIVEVFRAAVREITSRASSYYPLQFKESFYFEVPNLSLPTEAGWYIILDSERPVYVGKADNLHNRLNTNQGSLDKFAHKSRNSEPERSFIKKFIEIEAFHSPRVCIILRSELADKIGVPEKNLTTIDISNIEKVINLLRDEMTYVELPI